jgi:hypothetical protein
MSEQNSKSGPDVPDRFIEMHKRGLNIVVDEWHDGSGVANGLVVHVIGPNTCAAFKRLIQEYAKTDGVVDRSNLSG